MVRHRANPSTGRTAKPSLEQIEMAAVDDYESNPTGHRNRYPTVSGSRTITEADTVGSGDCWCGQPFGHDWPGKADRQSHPRETR